MEHICSTISGCSHYCTLSSFGGKSHEPLLQSIFWENPHVQSQAVPISHYCSLSSEEKPTFSHGLCTLHQLIGCFHYCILSWEKIPNFDHRLCAPHQLIGYILAFCLYRKQIECSNGNSSVICTSWLASRSHYRIVFKGIAYLWSLALWSALCTSWLAVHTTALSSKESPTFDHRLCNLHTAPADWLFVLPHCLQRNRLRSQAL